MTQDDMHNVHAKYSGQPIRPGWLCLFIYSMLITGTAFWRCTEIPVSPYEKLNRDPPIEFSGFGDRDTLYVGDTVSVAWKVTVAEIDSVVLYISIDGGNAWSTVDGKGVIPIDHSGKSDESVYLWTIGREYPPERPDYTLSPVFNNCLLKIEYFRQSGFPPAVSPPFTIMTR